MSATEKVVIFIPSLDPDEKLIGVIRGLREIGFRHIVCLDDGSKSDNRIIFDRAKDEFDCEILRHCVNLGKGRALKDGFNHICNEYEDLVGIVTVDGDGQHSAKDTLKVANALCEYPDELIMGCRNFKLDNIPARSKFGNVTTSRVMKLLCGISLSDTQTGLRGIPMSCVRSFVKVSGERFEYELNMILESKNNNIKLHEVEIETIYLDENTSSHFNPLLDSIRIYSMFFKYMISSLSSSIVDLVLFTMFCSLFKYIVPTWTMYIAGATVLARIISATFNYTVNRMGIFGDENSAYKSMLRYAMLAVANCVVSALAVYLIFNMIHINETVIKVIVDSILFMVSYTLQREWVFKK